MFLSIFDLLESIEIKGFKALFIEKDILPSNAGKTSLKSKLLCWFSKSQEDLIIRLKYFSSLFNGIFANPKDNKESLLVKKFLYFLSTGLRLFVLEELEEYRVLATIFPFKKFRSKIKSSVNRFILK